MALIQGNDGDDVLASAAGDDTIDGGAGRDAVTFNLPEGTVGTLRRVDNADGSISVRLLTAGHEEDVFVVTPGANGAATVQGVGIAAFLGTDTVSNVEDLWFTIPHSGPFDEGRFVGLFLRPTQFGDFVSGSIGDDVIAIADYPGAFGIDADAGDDQLLGDNQNNYLRGRGGDDLIDGGSGGNDIAGYALAKGTPGSLRVVGGNGVYLVELVQADGSAEAVFRVTPTVGGGAIAEGLGRAAIEGTDTVTAVEDLHFFIETYPEPSAPGQFANIRLQPIQYGEWVSGSVSAEAIDLASFPGAINADGGDGDDTLTGTALDNYLIGGGGDDAIDGAAGTRDIASFQLPVGTAGSFSAVESAGALLVQLDGATFLEVTITGPSAARVVGVGVGAFMGTDTLTNIEDIHIFVPSSDGTNSLPNQFVSIPLSAVQFGDFVAGSEGADAIDLAAFPGAINANGNRGDDSVTGTEASNGLQGGSGNDLLQGMAGQDNLQGNEGDDILRGGADNDYMIGGSGNDAIDGGAGSDVAAFNLPEGTAGSYRVVQGTGIQEGKLVVERVDGALVEAVFIVTLRAGAATVEGVGSAAFLGTDTVQDVEELHFLPQGPFDPNRFVSIRVAPVQNGNNVLGTDAGETIDLSLYPGAVQANGMAGDDVLVGTDEPNNLFGNVGDDAVDGRGGNDLIVGGPGDDQLFGEDGNDTLLGGFGNDQMSGGTGDDAVLGEFGDDVINGGAGNDVLRGGVGIDSFDGGADNGASGLAVIGDRISFFEANATQGAVADLRVGIIFNDGFGNTETMTGIESIGGDTAFADEFDGNDSANVLIGSVGDMLRSHGGDDEIHITGAAATVDGGAGTDLLALGQGGNLTPDANGDGFAETQAAFTSGWLVNLNGGFALDGLGRRAQLLGIENVLGSTLNDQITGNADANVLKGAAGDDNLRGEAGNDHLIGGDGSDLMRGGAGVDSFDGGSEDPNSTWFGPYSFNDRISFFEAQATSGVIADLRTGIISNDGFGNVESMTGIESLGGNTAFADHFYGNDGRNLLLGGSGDTLMGYGGDDIIDNGGAAALVDGGDGVDLMFLSNGGGSLTPDTNGDGIAEIRQDMTSGWFLNLNNGFVQDGYGGTGVVRNIENVIGSSFNDTIFGSGAANLLNGGDGDDNLRGEGGDDVLNGGDGSDLMRGGAGVDSFEGGDEVLASTTFGDGRAGDRISFYELRATSGVIADLATGIIANDGFGNFETMTGIESLGGDTAFADRFYGDDGRNVLFGARGDTVSGRGGDDGLFLSGAAGLADGGDGIDTLTFGSAGHLVPDSNGDGFAEDTGLMTAGWLVDLSTGFLQDGFGFIGSVANVEHVDGGEFADTLIGNAGGNILRGFGGDDALLNFGLSDDRMEGGDGSDYAFGGAGNDQLLGEAGNDYLLGGAGDDRIDGGDGIDRVGYSRGATAGVSVDLRLAGVAQNTGHGFDTLVSIEHVSGTVFSDTITGDDSDNWLWGGSDGSGVTGNDTISGGGGNDLVEVGTGSHVLDGGAGVDTLSLYGNFTDITPAGVTFSLAFQGAAQDSEQGLITATGFENLMGSGYDDVLTGDAGTNILAGYSGADQLIGGGGNDLLLGDGAVFPTTAPARNSGPIATLIDAGGNSGDDRLEGGDGDDSLVGGHGNDQLLGGADNDFLVGGGGNDSLNGGTGADYAAFYFDPSLVGTYSVVAGTGADAGKMLVMLANAGGSQRMAEIVAFGTSVVVTGVGAGANIGTDSVSNTEKLLFSAFPGNVLTTPVMPGYVVLNVGTTSGTVVDGYVADATVFVDNNRNGLLDVGEATAGTDRNGNFTLLNFGDGPILAVGGTNTDTGLPNQMVLAAPNGASIVNPLTTLVQAVADRSGISAAGAEAQVKAALGLDPTLALLSTDIFAAARGGDAAALQAQKAAAIVVAITIAAGDASTDGDAGEAAAVSKLADIIANAVAAGATVDVTDAAVIEAVLVAAAPDAGDLGNAADSLSTTVTEIAKAKTLEEVSEAQAEALLTGNDLGNVLIGGAAGDTLTGNGGDDLLNGNGGDDVLIGGAGNDVLNGGNGFDRIYGGTGSDTIILSGGTPRPGAARSLAIDVVFDFGAGDTLAFDDATFLGSELFGNVNAAEKTLGVDLDGLPKHTGAKKFVTVVYGDSNGDGVADFAAALIGVKEFSADVETALSITSFGQVNAMQVAADMPFVPF